MRGSEPDDRLNTLGRILSAIQVCFSFLYSKGLISAPCFSMCFAASSRVCAT